MLTVRQYGAFVLAGAVPGMVLVPHASGARKLSRRARRECGEQRGYKEGMPAPTKRSEDWGAVFGILVQVLLGAGAIAVQD